MARLVIGAAVLTLFSGALIAQDADQVKDKLLAAKRAYDAEMGLVRKQAGEWFDKREEAARDAGDKKLVEQFKAERVAFEDRGALPTNAPAALKAKQDQALEAAYTQAAKDYAKANKAAEAAAVEAELKNIRSLSGKDRDLVMDRLLAAKNTYDTEAKQVRKQVEEWFDKREEAARNAGDKKLLDQVKTERKVFTESEELPKVPPPGVQQKATRARKALETAYEQAIKEYTATKKDNEAGAVEKSLLDFRKGFWKHLDLSKATFKDDFVRLPPRSEIPTAQKYAGGFEIVLVARTESENIRLWAPRGSALIFNWELNPRELRVTRPDGTAQTESGSIATAKVTPLKPNTWYTLKWRVTEEGMQVSVDGKVVFTEQKRYELTEAAPITVRSEKSVVDIKELRITSLAKDR